jgi:hypothetical protein
MGSPLKQAGQPTEENKQATLSEDHHHTNSNTNIAHGQEGQQQ